MNDKKLFKKFMKDRGLWKVYKKNYKEYSLEDIMFHDFLNETDPTVYIWSSFHWRFTEEGREFWLELGDLWELYLEAAK